MTYQPNVPTGFIPLNQDYLNLQQNFTQINNQYNVDHVPLTSTSGTPPNGFHTVLHVYANTQTSGGNPNNYPPITFPASAGLTGELFVTQSNDGINLDEMLWWQTGGGKRALMTRNFDPIPSQNGATFLPGGLILQWGIKATSSLTDVVFPQPFPGNCFSVTATFQENSNISSNSTIIIKSFTTMTTFTTGFKWATNNTLQNFYWMAIGN